MPQPMPVTYPASPTSSRAAISYAAPAPVASPVAFASAPAPVTYAAPPMPVSAAPVTSYGSPQMVVQEQIPLPAPPVTTAVENMQIEVAAPIEQVTREQARVQHIPNHGQARVELIQPTMGQVTEVAPAVQLPGPSRQEVA